MALNIPDTRQSALADRLRDGQQIVAVDVAREFAVSLDTIRRDILALEACGKAHRVRGGAIPVAPPAIPIHERLTESKPISPALISAAIAEIGQAPTLMVDGGTTTLCVIEELPIVKDRLIITPSPWVAILCQKRGTEVFLLGGRLRPQGGIATGGVAMDRLSEIAVDIALLGACGIATDFGLSSDDHEESIMKRAMHGTARKTLVVTQGDKIGRKARHKTLALSDIDLVITDAEPLLTMPIAQAGTKVVTAV